MSEVIGDTSWLHSSTVSFKILVEFTGSSGVDHFSLSDRPEILAYTSSRALARIVGPLSVSLSGPASASKASLATIAIVPTCLTSWPSTRTSIRRAIHAVALGDSLYKDIPNPPLVFHEAINQQLKPAPLVGNQPAIVCGYNITGGSSTDELVIEISGKLQLDGIDYVAPQW